MATTENFDHVPVKSLTNPAKDGWLTKWGGKGLSANWKRRWFVVHEGVVFYFKTANAEEPAGYFNLKDYSMVTEVKHKGKNCFKIENPGSSSRPFIMYPDKDEEKRSWMTAISEEMQAAKTGKHKHGRSSSTTVRVSGVPSRKSASSKAMKFVRTLYLAIPEARRVGGPDASPTPTYVIADLLNCHVRTKPCDQFPNPFWGEELHINVEADGDMKNTPLKVTVWSTKHEKIIGQVNIPLSSLSDCKLHEQWYPLFAPESTVYVSGDIHLKMHHNTKDKTLAVRVLEGRNLASKDSNGYSDPYVKVNFNNTKKKTQVLRKTLNPFFNEEFIFKLPDHPASEDDLKLNVAIWDRDLLGSNEFMGEVVIPLSELEPDVVNDYWYILLPQQTEDDEEKPEASRKSTSSLGDIRMKLKFTEDPQLPSTSYDKLLGLLLSDGFTLVLALDKVTPPSEREDIARSLVRIFEAKNCCILLLNTLTEKEIKATQDAAVIFRGNTLATKAVDYYMKMVCRPYLESVILPTIRKIFANKEPFEVDPMKADKDEDIAKNWKRLKKLLDELLHSIFQSADKVPFVLRMLFNHLQNTVYSHFGQTTTTMKAKYSAVSGFFFLRSICPALLNPKLFHLWEDHPDPKTARLLTLVSKIVQNVANLAEFGQKEPFMCEANDLITQNLDSMRHFLDTISQPPVDVIDTEPPDIDLARELAIITRHLVRAKDDLSATFKDPETLEGKLVGGLVEALTDLRAEIAAYI